MRLPWRKRKPRVRPITEAEAYHHSYGERSNEVKAVKLPPRRPRFTTRISGEDLRRKFQERLERRDKGRS